MSLVEDFRNILIIKLKHLGDVLTTTPVLAGVKAAWPQAKVSYLVNPGCDDLVRFHPDVADTFIVPRGEGLVRQINLIREFRRRRFDLVLELSGGDRGAFLAWACGAGRRVGYGSAGHGFFSRRRLFTDLVTTVVDSKHTVDYHLDSLRALGQEPGYQPLALHWPPEAEARIRGLLGDGGLDRGAAYAVVHPGSRWMFKAWRPEGNAQVIDYLAGEADLPVVLTSAPEPRELSFVQEVLSRVRTKPLDLTGRLSLPELAALIAGARLFFGVDSLPMHMAAAVGTPAVALFGPSGEHMWAPWGPGHHVVAKDWDCRPCGRDGCDGSKVSRCLVEIEAEEIYPVLDRALEGQG